MFGSGTCCILVALLRGLTEYNVCKVPIAAPGWEKTGERAPEEGSRAHFPSHSWHHPWCWAQWVSSERSSSGTLGWTPVTMFTALLSTAHFAG